MTTKGPVIIAKLLKIRLAIPSKMQSRILGSKIENANPKRFTSPSFSSTMSKERVPKKGFQGPFLIAPPDIRLQLPVIFNRYEKASTPSLPSHKEVTSDWVNQTRLTLRSIAHLRTGVLILNGDSDPRRLRGCVQKALKAAHLTGDWS